MANPLPSWRCYSCRVEEFINDQSKNMVTSKPSLGLPQNVVSRFFQKSAPPLSLLPKTIPLDVPLRNPQEVSGAHCRYSILEIPPGPLPWGLNATSNKNPERFGDQSWKNTPNWLLLDPPPKQKQPTPTFGDPVANLKRMWARISKKVCVCKTRGVDKMCEFLKSRDIVIAGTPKMRLEIGELIEIPVKHPGIFSMICSWNRRI